MGTLGQLPSRPSDPPLPTLPSSPAVLGPQGTFVIQTSLCFPGPGKASSLGPRYLLLGFRPQPHIPSARISGLSPRPPCTFSPLNSSTRCRATGAPAWRGLVQESQPCPVLARKAGWGGGWGDSGKWGAVQRTSCPRGRLGEKGTRVKWEKEHVLG